MTSQHHLQVPRIEAALDELRQMIATRYPGAEFIVEEGFDPPGTYLVATVDVPDTDLVFRAVVDRLVDMQVEERLPVYVTVLRPRARVYAHMREQQSRRFPARMGDG
jgi:hypothetical protein